jgi:hypothetical protein
MSFLVISVLMGLSAYLALRLNAARSENVSLKANVASLKRQLRS